MKYRLLKPLGAFDAGSILEMIALDPPGQRALRGSYRNDGGYEVWAIVPAELAQDPNWFEEVKPWVPKDGDMYYYVADHLEACGEPFCESKTSVPTVDMQRANAGNCFRTKQDARDCAAQMRVLLAAWKEAHP